RKTALVYREPHMAARVDIQQWLLQGHIAEGSYEWNVHLRLANGDVDILAASVVELQKIFGADIGHQVAKRPVSSDRLAAQAPLVQPRRRKIQPDQLVRCNLRPHPGPVLAMRQMRPHRRENVSPMKSG